MNIISAAKATFSVVFFICYIVTWVMFPMIMLKIGLVIAGVAVVVGVWYLLYLDFEKSRTGKLN